MSAGRALHRTVAVELLAGGLVFVSAAALPLVFPGPGYFPFGFGDLVVVLAICGLLAGPPREGRPPRPGGGRPVRGREHRAVCLSRPRWATTTPVLAAYIGVPLVICYLPRFVERLAGYGATPAARRRAPCPADPGSASAQQRPASYLGALAYSRSVSLVVWHWTPIVEAFDGAANGPSSTAAYYQPLIDELDRLNGGRPVRVEIPPTVHHWESAYVAPVFPLARGWERQLDVAYDGLFYRAGQLPAAAYRSWLLSNGVSYVALRRRAARLCGHGGSRLAALRSSQRPPAGLAHRPMAAVEGAG